MLSIENESPSCSHASWLCVLVLGRRLGAGSASGTLHPSRHSSALCKPRGILRHCGAQNSAFDGISQCKRIPVVGSSLQRSEINRNPGNPQSVRVFNPTVHQRKSSSEHALNTPLLICSSEFFDLSRRLRHWMVTEYSCSTVVYTGTYSDPYCSTDSYTSPAAVQFE